MAALDQVAQTILQQLGGGGVITVMLGVKQFTQLEGGIGIRWKAHSEVGNHCEIKLDRASDSYTLRFFRIHRRPTLRDFEPTAAFEGLYCDQLIEVFERTTGLALHL